MIHPLIDQFRFTRSEWLRGLEGVTEEDGACHFGQMNCISWTVGHLAWHEQRTWLTRPQEIILFPKLNELFAYGAPMNTPSFREMLQTWRTVTNAADPFLELVDDRDSPNGSVTERGTCRPVNRLSNAAHHLSLLVSHRGDPGHPPDDRSHESSRICGRY